MLWGGTRPPAAGGAGERLRSTVSGGDHQRDAGRDFTVQLDVRAARPHRRDLLLELDLAPVEGDPMLLLERRRDVRIRYSAEQLAVLPVRSFNTTCAASSRTAKAGRRSAPAPRVWPR